MSGSECKLSQYFSLTVFAVAVVDAFITVDVGVNSKLEIVL